ncbi:hypothetical protein Tco_0153309 [Tanacetum coccineum]
MYFHHSIFLTPPLPFQTEFGRVRSEDFIVARMVKWAIRGLLTIGLYMAVEETLKAFGQGLCGKCMDLHVVSQVCHYLDGLVCFSKGSDDMSRYTVSISRPSNKELETEVTEGLVLDAELVDCVFKVLITTVKSIHHGCRFTFSQALKTVLCKVVAQPDYVDAWVGQVVTFSKMYVAGV